MTLTCANTGGRGRYRTADRWCVKRQDSVDCCPGVSNRCRSARSECPVYVVLSTLFVPVLGHSWDTCRAVAAVLPGSTKTVLLRCHACLGHRTNFPPEGDGRGCRARPPRSRARLAHGPAYAIHAARPARCPDNQASNEARAAPEESRGGPINLVPVVVGTTSDTTSWELCAGR